MTSSRAARRAFAFLTALSSVAGAARAAVFKDFAVPTPASAPTGIGGAGLIDPTVGGVWFTEFEANRISRIAEDGTIVEYPLATPSSGPAAIAQYPTSIGRIGFTEAKANKIAYVQPPGGVVDFAIPTPGSNPRGVAPGSDQTIWFTEFDGNKIGVLDFQGRITEYAIPIPHSGPLGITSSSGSDIWFTEFKGNKIGRIDGQGVVREYPLPTPASGPTAIVAGPNAEFWFTMFHANKIGRISQDGTITEFPLPTPDSGPTDIQIGWDRQTFWFTERLARKIGNISTDGKVREYILPASVSEPVGIAIGFRGDGRSTGVWFTDTRGNKVGRLNEDHLVLVGAGTSGAWGTELEFANPSDLAEGVYVTPQLGEGSVCAPIIPCFSGASLPARGTAALSSVISAPGVQTLYVRPTRGLDAPTTRAQLVNGARPTQAVELPAIQLSTLETMNPSTLSFPSATRSANVHSNLVVAEVSHGTGRGIDFLVEAYSATGDRLGAAAFSLTSGNTLFLVDVLQRLGVGELEDGQIRVTKTGGTGLMWGLLATLTDDGGVTVSPGMNP